MKAVFFIASSNGSKKEMGQLPKKAARKYDSREYVPEQQTERIKAVLTHKKRPLI
jgi:hypothetical protein